MQLYLAPMEGITGYVYRNTLARHFGHIDTYYTPFVSPNIHRSFSTKEKKDILPEHNAGLHVIPQVLTNNVKYFVWTAEQMQDRGYDEINLNLGCPSGTVVSKGRGSGFLKDLNELKNFLDGIFYYTDLKISLKTRLGVENPDEFHALLELFNRYPVHELILHPRVRMEFYKGTPHRDAFLQAARDCRCPISYNGDIFTAKDAAELMQEAPDIAGLMLGRGMLGNPGLAEEIVTGESLDKERFHTFCHALCEAYRQEIPEDRNVLFKMKELWIYQIHQFSNSAKYAKAMKKAKNLNEFMAAMDVLFREQELIPGAGFPGTP